MSTEVVALGAWCDLDFPDERVAAAGRMPQGHRPAGWAPAPLGARGASPGGAHFRVHEFAVLADGRRVTIRDDLGFSSYRASGVTRSVDPWEGMTRERVAHDVRNVVLPDDDESGDAHPYEWLRELLRRQGIETSAERLQSVPYSVEFSDRLERRLRGERPSHGR